MAKPYIHAQSSVKKFKGKISDYIKIHEWFDQTKAHFPDMRHRAILHSSFGIYLCAQVFGETIINSDGLEVSIRDLGEQHILEDMKNKTIPTIQDYLCNMELQDWMLGEGYPPSAQKIEEKRKNSAPKELKVFPLDGLLTVDGSLPKTLDLPLSPPPTFAPRPNRPVTYD